jgi:hypothetical protein
MPPHNQFNPRKALTVVLFLDIIALISRRRVCAPCGEQPTPDTGGDGFTRVRLHKTASAVCSRMPQGIRKLTGPLTLTGPRVAPAAADAGRGTRFFLASARVCRGRRVALARKGDLRPFRHVNLGLDEEMAQALMDSARRNERRLTEEVRYAVRRYLGIDDRAPREDAGVAV